MATVGLWQFISKEFDGDYETSKYYCGTESQDSTGSFNTLSTALTVKPVSNSVSYELAYAGELLQKSHSLLWAISPPIPLAPTANTTASTLSMTPRLPVAIDLVSTDRTLRVSVDMLSAVANVPPITCS